MVHIVTTGFERAKMPGFAAVIVSDVVFCFVMSCTGVLGHSASSTVNPEATYAFETSVNSLHSTVLQVYLLHCIDVVGPQDVDAANSGLHP